MPATRREKRKNIAFLRVIRGWYRAKQVLSTNVKVTVGVNDFLSIFRSPRKMFCIFFRLLQSIITI